MSNSLNFPVSKQTCQCGFLLTFDYQKENAHCNKCDITIPFNKNYTVPYGFSNVEHVFNPGEQIELIKPLFYLNLIKSTRFNCPKCAGVFYKFINSKSGLGELFCPKCHGFT
jgi:Zn finger protein HypA/HybF involved in hydrogenase expression